MPSIPDKSFSKFPQTDHFDIEASYIKNVWPGWSSRS